MAAIENLASATAGRSRPMRRLRSVAANIPIPQINNIAVIHRIFEILLSSGGGEPAKISKTVDSCRVPVAPTQLQRVPSHWCKSLQPKTFPRILDRRSINLAEDVGFATAACTWACAPQRLQRKERFLAVLPLDGKLLPNQFNSLQIKRHDFR